MPVVSKESFQNVLTTASKVSDTLDSALFYNAKEGSAFTVSIAGTFEANLRLMASFDEGTNWIQMAVFTAPDMWNVPRQPRAFWKLDGSGGGDFTSGSILIEFQKGGADSQSGVRLLTGDRRVVDRFNPLPMEMVGDSFQAVFTKSQVEMTGASGVLVAANAARKVVRVASYPTNDPAVIDPTGGTAGIDSGIPLSGGGFLEITGQEAQNAMTQFGTSTQKLTIYEGV